MSFHSAVSRAIWRTHQKQTRPPTTDSSVARARLFEIASKCMFDLLDIVVSLCTDNDSLFGQYLAHLDGAHMVGRLVPK